MRWHRLAGCVVVAASAVQTVVAAGPSSASRTYKAPATTTQIQAGTTFQGKSNFQAGGNLSSAGRTLPSGSSSNGNLRQVPNLSPNVLNNPAVLNNITPNTKFQPGGLQKTPNFQPNFNVGKLDPNFSKKVGGIGGNPLIKPNPIKLPTDPSKLTDLPINKKFIDPSKLKKIPDLTLKPKFDPGKFKTMPKIMPWPVLPDPKVAKCAFVKSWVLWWDMWLGYHFDHGCWEELFWFPCEYDYWSAVLYEPIVMVEMPPLVLSNPVANAQPVQCVVDGKIFELAPGDRYDLPADHAWLIEFDRGNGSDTGRYSMVSGVHEFALTDAGWELYRL